MLKSITIENFRCFEQIKIDGFRRINLIGGKNNAGKTALLEALLLYFYPTPTAVMSLKQARKESMTAIKNMPKMAWNTFFYDQDIHQHIKIKGDTDDKNAQEVTLSVSLSLDSKVFEDEEEEFVEFIHKNIGRNSPVISVLQIRLLSNQDETIKRNVVASSREVFSPSFPDENIPLISTSLSFSNQEIASQYDKLNFENQSDDVLNILKILDNSIEDAETFSMNEPTLYLTRKDQKRLPISLFGDAINRVTAIALELLNRDQNVLFIDEIENGIHYTSQEKFWKALFQLARELDTTIFATTHSLEMIKAFAAASQDYPEDGMYFELARNPRDQKIVAIKRDAELLEYALERGKPIRGE
ncbi:AAA family ATPase [Spirulina sp. CCNP1310]|uniref:AAA family ATPase n=1 Tax=Spirulina sp. CCNP1310 TaxID=3110249 RepID=UPI002B1E927D|nr:AAA family ATPase [Spirulina sp. CCNP1310]MEA5421498.1 AAA family ATPase [Spirulina sp. CCNP1310]